MTLEELQESANRDLKIDDTDLGTESINIPKPQNPKTPTKWILYIKLPSIEIQNINWYSSLNSFPFPSKST